MSQAGVDNVVVDVDLGTKCVLQRVELHWRSNFSPRHYTLEVSEEGRQWFLVHRCIVDPAKAEGDQIQVVLDRQGARAFVHRILAQARAHLCTGSLQRLQ